ncbi:AraC family transcriptional regulator [uncultured Maribacter sp.]|uniref:AraC family transcriptional regulator n=1 Tax=uncultured Maribacter sp. TaxID=431308 RepID=UPI00261687FB|nr:AraC family transcriptional regulator [uncultured Maribacter sp.]
MSKIKQYHLHKENPEKLQFGVYDLETYLENSGTHALKAHSHSYYQIIWIQNTGGTHYIDFNGYPVKENSLFFINKNQIHYFDAEARHKGVLIHFNDSLFRPTDLDIFLKYQVFNNYERPSYCLKEASLTLINSYIDLINLELNNENAFGYQEVIRSLVKSLLVILERVHNKENTSDVGLNHPYTNQYIQFKELIEEYYNQNYKLAEYASILNISTKTLTTITKTMANTSPAALIAERIILETKRLLAFTSLKVNEVGYKLGFDDVSYFVKYFKRHMNQSPTEYRNLLEKTTNK